MVARGHNQCHSLVGGASAATNCDLRRTISDEIGRRREIVGGRRV